MFFYSHPSKEMKATFCAKTVTHHNLQTRYRAMKNFLKLLQRSKGCVTLNRFQAWIWTEEIWTSHSYSVLVSRGDQKPQREKHAKATAQPFGLERLVTGKPSRVQMTRASFICWLFVTALVAVVAQALLCSTLFCLLRQGLPLCRTGWPLTYRDTPASSRPPFSLLPPYPLSLKGVRGVMTFCTAGKAYFELPMTRSVGFCFFNLSRSDMNSCWEIWQYLLRQKDKPLAGCIWKGHFTLEWK